jgi:hypothetical protein
MAYFRFKKLLLAVFTINILLFIALISSTTAQSLTPTSFGSTDSLTINTNPRYPQAYKDVSITLSTSSTDLNRATITWQVDGKLAKEGRGAKSFTVKTGALGSETTVSITVRKNEGGAIQKHIVLRPAEVDLIWENLAYVPPFYRGKALASRGAWITAVAIPHFITANGAKLKPDELVYTWSKDGQVLGSFSGFAKNTYAFNKFAFTRSNSSISVKVSTLDNKLAARANISIQSHDPKVVFYENNPLFGLILSRALEKQLTLDDNQDEIAIMAVPYYFSVSSASSRVLKYEWSLNGKPVETTLNSPQAITLRRTEGGGTSKLKLKISNRDEFMQFSENSLVITF